MRQRALLIGNGTFEDQRIPPLASPVLDSQIFGRLLAQPEVGDYDVKVCVDCPSWEVRREIQRFFDNADFDDVLLIYLSGHGLKDSEGKLHFGTRDTDRDAINASSLDVRFLHERMDSSAARKKILLIDSCYSGAVAIGWDPKGEMASVTREEFGEDPSSGKVVITASTSVQPSFENTEGSARQSRFTRHLIEGIETGAADKNQTGIITVDELYDYVRSAMRKEAANNPNVPKQTPQRWFFGLDGTMVVARNPRLVKSQIPERILAGLHSQIPTENTTAIDDLVSLVKHDQVNRDIAIQTITPFVENDSVLVQAVADRALKKLHSSNPPSELPKPPEPPMPVPETRRRGIAFGTLLAMLLAVLLFVLWPSSQDDPQATTLPSADATVPPPASPDPPSDIAGTVPTPPLVPPAAPSLPASLDPKTSDEPVESPSSVSLPDTSYTARAAYDCALNAQGTVPSYNWAICEDAELYKQHMAMGQVWWKLSSMQRAELKAEQNSWMYRSLNDCGFPDKKSPREGPLYGSLSCLLDKITARISYLENLP